jgi:hypothetical protein
LGKLSRKVFKIFAKIACESEVNNKNSECSHDRLAGTARTEQQEHMAVETWQKR